MRHRLAQPKRFQSVLVVLAVLPVRRTVQTAPMVLLEGTLHSVFSSLLADRKEMPAIRIREQAAETTLHMFMES
jgi:hypothetical protein